MKKIKIERRTTMNPQTSITLTPEAAECLLEVIQETGLSMKQAASTIIIQAVRNNLIEYTTKEDYTNEES